MDDFSICEYAKHRPHLEERLKLMTTCTRDARRCVLIWIGDDVSLFTKIHLNRLSLEHKAVQVDAVSMMTILLVNF